MKKIKIELSNEELKFIIGVLSVHESRQWKNMEEKFTPNTQKELTKIFMDEADRAKDLVYKLQTQLTTS